MVRRAKKKIKKRSAKKKSSSYSLLCVDNKPIRKEYLKQYKAAQTLLKKAEEKYLDFTTNIRPEYERWESVHLGQYLTEIRDLETELGSESFFLEQIENVMCFERLPPNEAYEKVRLARDDPDEFKRRYEIPKEENSPKSEFYDDDEEEDEEDDDGWGFDDLMDDFFEDIHRAFFGDDPEEEDEFYERKQTPSHAKNKSRLQSEEKLVKSKYRELAGKLHPDKRPESVANPKLLDELWYDLQAAYENNDLDEISRIEAICEAEVESIDESTCFLVIRKVTEHFKESAKRINREMKELKCTKAWKYFQAKDKEQFLKLDREEHKSQIRNLKNELRLVKKELEEIKNYQQDEPDEEKAIKDHIFAPPPKKKVKRVYKKKPPKVDPMQQEFDFGF
jgi:hypothetical protein